MRGSREIGMRFLTRRLDNAALVVPNTIAFFVGTVTLAVAV